MKPTALKLQEKSIMTKTFCLTIAGLAACLLSSTAAADVFTYDRVFRTSYYAPYSSYGVYAPVPVTVGYAPSYGWPTFGGGCSTGACGVSSCAPCNSCGPCSSFSLYAPCGPCGSCGVCGTCPGGACATGACATGACGTGACDVPQQAQPQQAQPQPEPESGPTRTYDDRDSSTETESEFPGALPAEGDDDFRRSRPRPEEGTGRTEAFKPAVPEEGGAIDNRSPAPSNSGSIGVGGTAGNEAEDGESGGSEPATLPAPPKAEDAEKKSAGSSSFGPELRLSIYRRPVRERLPVRPSRIRMDVADRPADVNSEWLPAPKPPARPASIAVR